MLGFQSFTMYTKIFGKMVIVAATHEYNGSSITLLFLHLDVVHRNGPTEKLCLTLRNLRAVGSRGIIISFSNDLEKCFCDANHLISCFLYTG